MCPRFRAVGFVESRSVDRREAIGVLWVSRGRVAGLPERLRNRARSHGASRAHNPNVSSSRHQSAANRRATCRRRSYSSRIGDQRGTRWNHRRPRDSVAPPPRARAQTHVKPCGASPPSPLWHALSREGVVPPGSTQRCRPVALGHAAYRRWSPFAQRPDDPFDLGDVGGRSWWCGFCRGRITVIDASFVTSRCFCRHKAWTARLGGESALALRGFFLVLRRSLCDVLDHRLGGAVH